MPTTTPIKMNVNEAKAKFSSLLAGVERTGQPVTILRYGHPVAQVVPMISMARQEKPSIRYGVGKGCYQILDDIDESNDEVGKLFAAEEP